MQDLVAALALLLVIEGIWPFLSPASLRNVLEQIHQADDRSLRAAGFLSMLAGIGLLVLVR